jgi:predicted  nucleic acid-binding Zn-ribbon protein
MVRRLLQIQALDLEIERLRRQLSSERAKLPLEPGRSTPGPCRTLSRQIKALEQQRNGALEQIPSVHRTAYESRRQVIQHPWVAKLVRQACSACGTRLPTPTVYTLLTRGEPHACLRCARLVVSAPSIVPPPRPAAG